MKRTKGGEALRLHLWRYLFKDFTDERLSHEIDKAIYRDPEALKGLLNPPPHQSIEKAPSRP